MTPHPRNPNRPAIWLATIAVALLALAGCDVLANHEPLTARQVIERAADATAGVTSLRYTGEWYSESNPNLDPSVDNPSVRITVEGTRAGGANYRHLDTVHLEDGSINRTELVSREGLALRRRIQDPPDQIVLPRIGRGEWEVWPPPNMTTSMDRPPFSPSYGVAKDNADYVTGITEDTLDGESVYVITIVRPWSGVPGDSVYNQPDVRVRLYIAKDTFLELGRDVVVDSNQVYRLDEGPDSDEPNWWHNNFRFADINADLSIDFPPGWDDFKLTPTQEPLWPTQTPTRTPIPDTSWAAFSEESLLAMQHLEYIAKHGLDAFQDPEAVEEETDDATRAQP